MKAKPPDLPNKQKLGKVYEEIQNLITQLLKSPEAPDEIQVCPNCGGQLHIGFGVYMRNARKMLGTQAECDNCAVALVVDWSGPWPAWLDVKGQDE